MLNETIELGNKILEKDPDNLRTNLILGRAYADNNQYYKAIPHLEFVAFHKLSIKWMEAWSHAYLGKCLYMTDNKEKSKKSLKYALKLNATKNVTNYTKKSLKLFQVNDFFNNWEMIETDHIRFHIQPNTKIKDLRNYSFRRESAYLEINAFFKARLPKKIDFYIWGRPDKASASLGRTAGFANPKFCIVNAKIDQTRGHEITHILLEHSNYKPIKKTKFIDEGIAVAFDLSNRDRIALAKSVNRNNFKIQQLIQTDKTLSNEVIYYIGGAFINYLRDIGGDNRLKKFIVNHTWEHLIQIYSKKEIFAFDKLIAND